MTDGVVNIENLHVEIENVIIAPGAAPEATFTDILDFLREQNKAGALTIKGEDGQPVPEESEDAPTPEEQEELDQAHAEEVAESEHRRPDIAGRANALHEVARHAAKARNLEGQKNGYVSSDRKGLQQRYDNAVQAAGKALEEACALCEFNNDCELRGNPERWIDVHPYKEGRKRRPEPSSDVPVLIVESRTVFLNATDAGVKASEQVHCDPVKRE